jgi:hypothetical protein
MNTLKHFFIYMDNPEEIKKKYFNKLLHRLNKPLFSFRELFEND